MDHSGAPPKRNVAVFLDMENLMGGYQKDVKSVPIGSIVREVQNVVQSHGVGSLVALTRAYANWGRADMAAYRREMLENGVEPVQVFSFNQDVKNAADIELVVDALEVATDSPWVDVFVIVSGDGGYIPLIRRLHVLGKYTMVVTTSHFASGRVSKLLRSAADHFHTIQLDDGAVAESSVTAETSRIPTITEYKQSIDAFLKKDPTLTVNGRVQGAGLGTLLRKRWPDGDYKNFGHRTLGSFVEEHCGKQMFRPNTTNLAPATGELASIR
ncbi:MULTISPECIES: NYN domain-containing protein [Crystallibacter]|uniref:NYN domain-containing protein n=1 Tax=Crystallibacter TaxID=3456524 RepID=UPI002225E9E9|nr:MULTISPECIES: NYN domain-containing protein [unclassified Arthrobacter]MCW2131603.1 Uncharacterized conserved protein, LabA/DUF88 family [Arthrobacter sp. VKM Ac-2550]